MKHINHKFKMQSGHILPDIDCSLYKNDIYIFCNKTVNELIMQHFPSVELTLQYIRDSNNIKSCLTEEEYAIKQILE